MFWGVKLEAEKQYSQLVEKPFHISHAAVGPIKHDATSGAPVFPKHVIEVHMSVEKTDYVICYLDASKNILQQPLDLRISEGEEIVLYCRGLQQTSPHDSVYLTGYFIEELGYPQALTDLANDEYSVSDSSDEDVDSDDDELLKSILVIDSNSESDIEYCPESDSEDEDYRNQSLLSLPPVIEEIREEETSAAVGGAKEGKEKSARKRKQLTTPPERSSETKTTSTKKRKTQDSRVLSSDSVTTKDETKSPITTEPVTAEYGTAEAKTPSKKKKNTKKENELSRSSVTPKGSAKSPDTTAKKKVKSKPIKLKTGTEYVDLVVGDGKMARPGKKVFVHYTGRLAQNNKVFDTNVGSGHTPFMFRLGVGEVIKGWDEAVAGMKVGGKRKLTIPPKQAYGADGAPPAIPPHSKLLFEVELVNVK